jgi:predicted nuclease with TOPRIM domain
MRFVMLLLVLIFSVIIIDNLSADKLELTELQKLKVENFQLKVSLTQCNATVSDRENRLKSIELTNEQSKLIEEFRKTLKADDKQEFDWTNLSFKPVTSDKK